MLLISGIIAVWHVSHVCGFMPRSFHGKQNTKIAMGEIFEGNPFGKFIWDQVWKLPIMKPGTPGTSPTTFGDNALVLKGNILQLYGDQPSVDGAPIATGDMGGFLEGSAFLGLQKYYNEVSHSILFYTMLYSIYSNQI